MKFRLPITYRGIPPFAACVDIILIVGSAVAAGTVYHFAVASMEGEFSRNMAAAVFIAVICVAATWTRKLYEPSRLLMWDDQVRSLLGTWCGAFLLMASGVFTWGVGKELSRGTILSFWALGGLALLAHRWFWRFYLPSALSNGAIRGRNCVLVAWGEGELTSYATLLSRHGYIVVENFEIPETLERSDDVMAAVVGFVRGQPIDDIFLAPQSGRMPDVVAAAKALRVLPVPVTMIPDPTLADLVANPRYELGSSLALEIQRPPLSIGERIFKRIFDLVIASIALTLLLPLFAAVAAAIALDSRGPVFFRQTRSGFNGQPFKIFKFRSMTVTEDGQDVGQAKRGDARVTRVGAFMRRTSIDELPQLLNVLSGEMSIVGPRPHVIKHDVEFTGHATNYPFRHHVKAGMTGWAQVHGARGETDTVEKIQRRTELDLWYVKHWSLGLDFSILLRTVAVVLQGKNAY